MAFMMPVMKNDWDIYHSNRSRKTSECNNQRTCRMRKTSETTDNHSIPCSPGSMGMGAQHRSAPTMRSTASYCRSDSRGTRNSFQRPQSPCKSSSPSPPKNSTKSSIEKFHTRLVDKLKRSLSRSSDSPADNERSS